MDRDAKVYFQSFVTATDSNKQDLSEGFRKGFLQKHARKEYINKIEYFPNVYLSLQKIFHVMILPSLSAANIPLDGFAYKMTHLNKITKAGEANKNKLEEEFPRSLRNAVDVWSRVLLLRA